MKRFIILLIFVALIVSSGFAQQAKRNSLSVSLGVWELDMPRYSNIVDHTYGLVGAIEYQRELNDYFEFRGKASFGNMSSHREVVPAWVMKHTLTSVGVLITPLGRTLKNFKLGVSPAYILTLKYQSADPNKLESSSSYFGIEIPVRFNFIDNDKYLLGIGIDLIYILDNQSINVFTTHLTLSYGLKF